MSEALRLEPEPGYPHQQDNLSELGTVCNGHSSVWESHGLVCDSFCISFLSISSYTINDLYHLEISSVITRCF